MFDIAEHAGDKTPIEIALGVDSQGRTTARKLYEFLELNPAVYSRWVKMNILENPFAEAGTDYEVLNIRVENPLGGRPTTDYLLSASFAKKLAMGTRNERGEIAKNYFVKVEEKLKQVIKQPYHQIPQTYPEALRLAADLAEQNQKLLPKAEQFDKFISGENYQSMNLVAKSLGTGRNRLFQFLRDHKVLLANNVPYQRFIDAGYFVVKEKPIQMGDQVINKIQTYVTAKGVDWIAKLLEDSV